MEPWRVYRATAVNSHNFERIRISIRVKSRILIRGSGWCRSTTQHIKRTTFHKHFRWCGPGSGSPFRTHCCGSGMFISDPTFFHPGSEFFPPGSRIRIKEFKYLNPKNYFLAFELWSGFFIPDPYPDFLPIPDPGSKRHRIPHPGSGSATLFGFMRIRIQHLD